MRPTRTKKKAITNPNTSCFKQTCFFLFRVGGAEEIPHSFKAYKRSLTRGFICFEGGKTQFFQKRKGRNGKEKSLKKP